MWKRKKVENKTEPPVLVVSRPEPVKKPVKPKPTAQKTEIKNKVKAKTKKTVVKKNIKQPDKPTRKEKAFTPVLSTNKSSKASRRDSSLGSSRGARSRRSSNVGSKKSTPTTGRSRTTQPDFGVAFPVMLPHRCNIFDNLAPSGSAVSELSLPFSDVSTPSGSEKDLKDLGYQHDFYSVFSFSPHFKSTIDHIKTEKHDAKLNTLVSETYEQILEGGKIPISYKIPKIIQRRVVNLLNDDTYSIKSEMSEIAPPEEEPKEDKIMFDPKRNWEDLKDDVLGKGKKSILTEYRKFARREKSKTRRPSQKRPSVAGSVEDDEVYETMSGYWRLLSAFDEFKISPPVYDAYQQDKPHWLETKALSYEVYETSRKKCMDWLQKYFHKY